MTLRGYRLFHSATGSALVVVCGLALWATSLGDGWINASYDYLFRFIERTVPQRVVLIQMDNGSFESLQQERNKKWDRGLHAQLLNRLSDDGCRLVIMDVRFGDLDDTNRDDQLAAALRRQKQVVLMAGLEYSSTQNRDPKLPDAEMERALPPHTKFLEAASNCWGVAWVTPDPDGKMRHHWPFPAPAELQSLAWSAAKALGAQLAFAPVEQWLRYYSQDGAWATVNYSQATNQVAGYFKDKIVLIGNKPANPDPAKPEDDKFSVPYTRWTGEAVGGMQIIATELLNLVNGDWLRRPAWWIELGVLTLGGILLGAGLSQMRPVFACSLAAVLAIAVSLAGISLSQVSNYWFPWLVVVGGQLPCALACSLLGTKLGARDALAPITELPRVPEFEAAPSRQVVTPGLPDADDYELFPPPFGEGSYGQVWLARNAIGQWQALKTVYLAKFGANSKPYEREFNGIRRYKPISDKHPGLLRVDFVSRKKQEGYFYYVMELGDPMQPGWEAEPSKYKPQDLAKLLAQTEGHRLPARECLRIAILLAEALEFLHTQGLTHGDIKPQNIIFVNGQPKLADVGLVDELLADGQNRTGVGTFGYMPPCEPVGTPQADIYGLGMVLYGMFMGHQPASFPSVATTLVDGGRGADFVRLNSIILRACHPDRELRYKTAGNMAEAMRDALATLEQELV